MSDLTLGSVAFKKQGRSSPFVTLGLRMKAGTNNIVTSCLGGTEVLLRKPMVQVEICR
jgi:hypothetical protein